MKQLIGQKVSVHPVVKLNPDDENYMKWSVKLNGLVVVYVKSIHLENCRAELNHKLIDGSIRSMVEGKGSKAPIVLLNGTVKDVEFDFKGVGRKWKSATYNPHKCS